MKTVVFGAALALAPVALLAQTDTIPDQTGNRPGSTANQSSPGSHQPVNTSMGSTAIGISGAGGSESTAAVDRIFLRKAAMAGNGEILLGQLSSRNGSTDEVRKLGQKMVDDHTTLNGDLRTVAETRGFRLPQGVNHVDEAEYDKLRGLSGAEFDKEYLAYIGADQHRNLHYFHQEASTTQDPALKLAVIKGEKEITEHTKVVDKMAVASGTVAAQ